MSEAQATKYDPIAVSPESTVVAEYVSDTGAVSAFQSEAALESESIKQFHGQARDYLISVSSYVEAEDTRAATDITAHNSEIVRIVARQSELRAAIDAIVADLEGAP